MSPLVEIKGLFHRTEDGVALFEDVNIALERGEMVVIIGPLGSGKSTLIRLMGGIERPERGKVCLFGHDIGTMGRRKLDRLRRQIGVVFMNAALVSNLKIIENVALPILFHTTLSNNDGLKRALELLRRVGFTGDVWSLPGPLPFYKKKVVAFARAMALDPDIVICNRFLVGLDKQQRGHMLGLLDEFQKAKEGRLTILTTSEERDFAVLPLSRKYRIKEKGLRRIDE